MSDAVNDRCSGISKDLQITLANGCTATFNVDADSRPSSARAASCELTSP